MSGEAFEVSYSLTEADVDAYARHHVSTRPELLLAAFMSAVNMLALAAASFVSVVALTEPGSPIGWLPLVVASPVILVLAPLLKLRGFRRVMRRAARSQGIVGPHLARISPEGFYVRAEATGETLKYWKSIHRIVSTDAHIFVYVTPHMAFIVPRAAFADVAACDAFLLRARQWNAAARPPVAPGLA